MQRKTFPFHSFFLGLAVCPEARSFDRGFGSKSQVLGPAGYGQDLANPSKGCASSQRYCSAMSRWQRWEYKVEVSASCLASFFSHYFFQFSPQSSHYQIFLEKQSFGRMHRPSLMSCNIFWAVNLFLSMSSLLFSAWRIILWIFSKLFFCSV